MNYYILLSAIICLLFFASWVIRTPDILWNSLLFKYSDTLEDRIVSVIAWVFFAGSVTAVVLLTNILVAL